MSSTRRLLVYFKWKGDNIPYLMRTSFTHLEFSLDSENLPASVLGKHTQKLSLEWKHITGCQCMHLKHEGPSHYAFLTLYTYQPDVVSSSTTHGNPPTTGDSRVHLKRKVYTLVFFQRDKAEDNLLEAKELQSTLLEYINQGSGDHRPYLIFINPTSGSGNAHNYFEHIVNRIFSEASIGYELVLTEYCGHARQVVKTMDCNLYRGVVVVSGDGLVHEVLNGLADRKDWLTVSATFPIGVVAGGSGNGMAASVAFGSGHIWKSPEELILINSLLLVSPRMQPMDLVVTEYEKTEKTQSQQSNANSSTERRVSFLSLTWGLLANIDIDSEPLRFLGELRFTVAAMAKILTLTHYQATIQYLPVDESQESHEIHGYTSNIDIPALRDSMTFAETSAKLQESKSAVALRYRTSSMSSYNSVSLATSAQPWPLQPEEEESVPKVLRYDSAAGDEEEDYQPTDNQLCTSSSAVKVQSYKREESSQSSEPCNGIESYNWRYLPPLMEPIPEDTNHKNWISENGEYVTVCATYRSHLSGSSILDSTMKFDNGYIILVLVKRGVTRKSLLSFLSDFEGSVKRKNDYLKVIRVKAFRLIPMGTSLRRTRVTLDGEEITSGAVQCELLPKVGRVIMGKIAHS